MSVVSASSATISILLMVTTFAFSPAVSAANFNVTRMDDPVPNGCATNNCSLREAVLAANQAAGPDTISLTPGTYLVSLNGFDTDETGDLDIQSDLTIRGPATIDGQGQGRIFSIEDDSEVVFIELVLQNANTSLASNSALNGGAVEINGGRLTIRSGVFRENMAQTHGAAIYTTGGAALVVENSVFFNNQSANGAGIFANGDVTVRNSLFEDNVGGLRAAALYLAGTQSDVVLEHISLIDNEGADSAGGAVLFLGRDLLVHDLLAIGNKSLDGNGGVLATTGTAHNKNLRISHAIFADNSADNGGALYFADDDDPVEIVHSAFVNNSALRQAGAIYITGGPIDIANVTLSGNSAGTDGGGIHLFGGDMTLRHVTFTGGTANRGSEISLGGSSAISSASLTNTIISGNCNLSDADSLVSKGGNIESMGNSCSFNHPSDKVSVSASGLGLKPLQRSTGATPSHPLNRVSAARAAGVPAICQALPVDQLFRPRPPVCSAGAVSWGILFADGLESGYSLGSDIDFQP